MRDGDASHTKPQLLHWNCFSCSCSVIGCGGSLYTKKNAQPFRAVRSLFRGAITKAVAYEKISNGQLFDIGRSVPAYKIEFNSCHPDDVLWLWIACDTVFLAITCLHKSPVSVTVLNFEKHTRKAYNASKKSNKKPSNIGSNGSIFPIFRCHFTNLLGSEPLAISNGKRWFHNMWHGIRAGPSIGAHQTSDWKRKLAGDLESTVAEAERWRR